MLDRDQIRDRLERLRALFGEGDALAAWAAFLLARENELEQADWVLEYLEGAADRLVFGKAATSERLGPIGKALGFKAGLATTQRQLFERDKQSVALEIASTMKDLGISLRKAAEGGIAGVSGSTAQRHVEDAVAAPTEVRDFVIAVLERAGLEPADDPKALVLQFSSLFHRTVRQTETGSD